MSDLNIAEAEDKLITIALARTDGNRHKAAKLLGISVETLWRRIKLRMQADSKKGGFKERRLL